MQKPKFYGWKLLAAFWAIFLVNMSFPTYGSSVINAYMAPSLHFDRKMLGGMFALFQLMCGLPGPLVAYCVNRTGIRCTVVFGSLLIVLGSALMAFWVHTGWQAIFVFGVIVGFGSAAGGSISAQAGIANWFIKKRSLASSLRFTAGGIGGFIAAPLLNRVIAASGGDWRMGWWVIAALALGSVIIAALFIRERPSDLGQYPDGEVPGASAGGGQSRAARPQRVYVATEDWTFREAMRSPTLWLLMLAAFGISMGFATFMAHGVVHLKGLGHSASTAALGISVMAISSLIGKLVAAIGDRIEPRYVWSVMMGLFSIGIMIALHATTVRDLYLCTILMGLGWGGTAVCMLTIPMNYFGRKGYASIMGIMFAVQTTIAAIAPVIAGYLYDEYRSYGVAFYGAAALCFAGALLLLKLTPPLRRQALAPAAQPLARSAVEV